MKLEELILDPALAVKHPELLLQPLVDGTDPLAVLSPSDNPIIYLFILFVLTLLESH